MTFNYDSWQIHSGISNTCDFSPVQITEMFKLLFNWCTYVKISLIIVIRSTCTLHTISKFLSTDPPANELTTPLGTLTLMTPPPTSLSNILIYLCSSVLERRWGFPGLVKASQTGQLKWEFLTLPKTIWCFAIQVTEQATSISLASSSLASSNKSHDWDKCWSII